jgi:predicted RecA/RadA family phage recombinase
MSLPASQDNSSDHQGYVIKEKVTQDDHIEITADSAINQGDFVKATPFFGLADEDIASGAQGTIHVAQVYEVGSDMIGSGETFDTWGQEVYWDTNKSKFYESEGDGGRYLVGYVRKVEDSNDVFRFEGLRFHGAEAST